MYVKEVGKVEKNAGERGWKSDIAKFFKLENG